VSGTGKKPQFVEQITRGTNNSPSYLRWINDQRFFTAGTGLRIICPRDDECLCWI